MPILALLPMLCVCEKSDQFHQILVTQQTFDLSLIQPSLVKLVQLEHQTCNPRAWAQFLPKVCLVVNIFD